MDEKKYFMSYRKFFKDFSDTLNPEDQLPVHVAGYTITEAELPGEVLHWTTQYLTEKKCPPSLLTPLTRIILEEVLASSKKQPNDFGFRSNDSVFLALRLMQATLARVNDICLRYLDNSKLDTLPPPPPPELRERLTSSVRCKNSRRVMEDRHVEIGNLDALFGIETTEPTSFYGVYDGHAGSGAAVYCAAHLHQYLVESTHYKSDLRKALREAFIRTDEEFIRKEEQHGAKGGSTAVVVVIRGRTLYSAWVGDSQALLAKRLKVLQLVRPHKPSREDEKERIESMGGNVIYWGTWRVNGQLAVSRAIGDAQYKPYVTAEPELETVELDGDEDFVVIASDGLWDFVSEDQVALNIYVHLVNHPDKPKQASANLVAKALYQGSVDNISCILVYLKDPLDIAANNRPPMENGQDHPLANAPMPIPYGYGLDSMMHPGDIAASDACEPTDADNGVDNSDSDSEDLGPETAVDVDDLDADIKSHVPEPATPPAHTIEASVVVGGLVADNVAESGEESEDEWNYYKGEGDEKEPHSRSEPRSPTPLQDNSGCESSSVDMNSSPLNPDAPVFVPGTAGAPGVGAVAAADVLLAGSPRKPLNMEDIELPDSAQFQTEAVVRPNELLDLDNCDQLNGHHNISVDEVSKEILNGNDKCTMDSLGFGFTVGTDPDKQDIIQDLERIQKDTTDFCNIQVFQSHTETNPFAIEGNEELLERLKNKERDPMSMSFYQEKDEDSCQPREPAVDLNAVQPLPDSDEDEPRTNGAYEDKENIRPLADTEEPNNDMTCHLQRHLDDVMDFTRAPSNPFPVMDFTSNVDQPVLQTDTPESHKLMFEQIPEIPDGKSSELGFTDEGLEVSESEARLTSPHDDVSQDVDMESRVDEPESQQDLVSDKEELATEIREDDSLAAREQDNPFKEVVHHVQDFDFDTGLEDAPVEPELQSAQDLFNTDNESQPIQDLVNTDISGEKPFESDDFVQVHHSDVDEMLTEDLLGESEVKASDDVLEPTGALEQSCRLSAAASPAPVAESPAPSPAPSAPLEELAPSPAPAEPAAPSPAPREPSPVPAEPSPAPSPVPADPSPAPSPAPAVREPSPAPSPVPAEPVEPSPVSSPLPVHSPAPAEPPARSPSPPAPLPVDEPEPSPAAEPTFLVDSVIERLQAPELRAGGDAGPDLVTDLDAPVESRAQEICVPVASELPEQTPPPALQETAIAAATIAAAAAAAAATPLAKKHVAKTTPKPASATKTTPKPAATKTTPIAKKLATTTAASPKTTVPARPAAAKAPATKPAATKPAAPRPAPAARPTAKVAPLASKPPAKEAPPKTTPTLKEATKTTTTAKTAPARPASGRPAPATARAPAAPKPAPRAAPAPRAVSAPRPAPAAARPAPVKAAPKPREPPKPAADKKPMTNGEARPPIRRPTTAPAAPAAPRPSAAPAAPRPAAARPATTAAKTSTVNARAAPRVAPRAPLDKTSKELANKRATAAAANRTERPPPIKAPAKMSAPKAVPKKPVETKKPEERNGLTNGTDESKPPASPPAVDNALLPDVIA